MTMTMRVLLGGICIAAFTAPAIAGEVTGNGKSTPIQGASICQFSGQNDDPDSTDPENPGGRTQSFGQDVVHRDMDPTIFNPGDICSPTILPWKPIGGGNQDN